MPERTLFDLLADQARARGDAPAVLAPGRRAISFSALWASIEHAGDTLAALGLGRASRIACVVRPRPEIAVALLACTRWAACAPLSPDLEADAYRVLLPRLRVDAVVASQGDNSTAVAIAHAAGIRVLTLAPSDGAAGMLDPWPDSQHRAVVKSAAGSGDIALILHTSGTTATPKIVPLTQAQLLARCHAMSLTALDRSLCVAPLFTSTGLKYGLFAPLCAGASIVWLPEIRADRVIKWLDEFKPTYLKGSPTFFAALLGELERAPRKHTSTLRFVRTGASALEPALQARLEAMLGVPVAQGYGMTEVGTVAQVPLEPGKQRPGSVGLPLENDVVVVDERGDRLPPNAIGEVAVRGPGVTSGYENDLDANRAAFVDGWFRTGDLGYLDADGYLYLRGRLKEMINRGGTKVSPVEVDEVLLRHPAVREAAAFGIPHASLGEDVAAAVVLKQPGSVDDAALRDFCLEYLSPHKVPSRVVPVDELPRNAQGKVKRLQLAEMLMSDLGAPFLPARDSYEELVTWAFARVLAVDKVGVHDNFFHLGGDSLLAVLLLEEIERRTGRRFPLDALWYGRGATVAGLAALLRQDPGANPWPMLVPISPDGRKPPLFCVHTTGGNLFHYDRLASALRDDRPVYGLQGRGVYRDEPPRNRLEDIASDAIEAMRTAQPAGPYRILGFSSGGFAAFEIAQQLSRLGEKVAFLGIMDTTLPSTGFPGIALRGVLRALRRRSPRELQERLYHAFLHSIRKPGLRRLQSVGEAHRWARWSYRPEPYPGEVHLFAAEHSQRQRRDPALGWKPLVGGNLLIHAFPGKHSELVTAPGVAAVASLLACCLRDSDGGIAIPREESERIQ